MLNLNSSISRQNSGKASSDNFFVKSKFSFWEIWKLFTRADSGDIKILVRHPGNSILKFLVDWICVGCTNIRGRFQIKVGQLDTLSIDYFDVQAMLHKWPFYYRPVIHWICFGPQMVLVPGRSQDGRISALPNWSYFEFWAEL